MNDKHPHKDDPSVTSHGRSGVSMSRRRFTRAGLSGSVVLGSLASKPVLGAVPYHCTVSGQVSGNLSRATVAGECQIGRPPSYWTTVDWTLVVSGPAGSGWYVRGTLPNNGCSFSATGLIRGTNFNGFTPGGGVPALTPAFYNVAGSGSCNVVTTSSSNLATMFQVLSKTNGGDEFLLGRVVVASLLNARSLGVEYPVTEHTIIAMFNATFGGGDYYPFGGTAPAWNRARVIEYLSSLFRAT